MASVKVAVRVRPPNQREIDLESATIIEIVEKTIHVTNLKIPEQSQGDNCRFKTKHYTFDYSYWSVSKNDSHYASQKKIFEDLGLDVVDAAYEGYNACVFAYGQTGSGKTHTMTGSKDDQGLIPRICKELFNRTLNDSTTTYRVEVSYLEIYNETVRDLLPINPSKSQQTLRIREHPKDGPYVQDLSRHIVTNYEDISNLIKLGGHRRTTAATNMNDCSSRSHAIFTISFTQAKFNENEPCEMYSNINLVDLAGSERADATGNTGIRLKEGGLINRSLVTLGNVISALADLSDRVTSVRTNTYIPYRDSILTWLLKDSLGGNSKTIMIATVSPADCNYAETVSTLRYANRAKNILNKPTINEDPNVKLIKDLRSEIARLRTLLGGNIDKLTTPKVQEKLHENEARVKVLTEEWTGRWREMATILEEEKTLALRKEGLGVVLDSELPHLIGIDDDILSTGIVLYHLKEGNTTIGTEETNEKQNIVLQSVTIRPKHCIISNKNGQVSLIPLEGAQCMVNGNVVVDPVILTQGAVIMLGKTNMFRFNHPLQVTQLRKDFIKDNSNLCRFTILSQSMADLSRSTDNLSTSTSDWEMEQRHQEQLEALERKRQEVAEMEERLRTAEESWQFEHASREEELEKKRRVLEDMQKEAENAKHEAELAQQEIKEEKAKWKRKSLDIQQKLKLYRSNSGGQLNLSVFDEDLLCSSKESTLTDHHEEVKNTIQSTQNLIKVVHELRSNPNIFDSVAEKLDEMMRVRIESEIQNLNDTRVKINQLQGVLEGEVENEERTLLSEMNVLLQESETEIAQIEQSKLEYESALDVLSSEAEMPDSSADETQGTRIKMEKNRLENLIGDCEVARAKLQEMTSSKYNDIDEKLELLKTKKNTLIDELDSNEKQAKNAEDVYEVLLSGIVDQLEKDLQKLVTEGSALKNNDDNLRINGEDTFDRENNGITHMQLSENLFEDQAKKNSDSEYKSKVVPVSTVATEELHSLEQLLQSGTFELEMHRHRFEKERQQQLDKIDMERFQLEEMEHEEKINALVELEVKRRLFEERVQREKFWAIERSKEQKEREEEMANIKNMHHREMAKLKQKYEHSPTHNEGNCISYGSSPFNSQDTNFNSFQAARSTSVSVIYSPQMDNSQPLRPSQSTSGLVDRLASVPSSGDCLLHASIPSFIYRRSGFFSSYVDFQVMLTVGNDGWVIFRRYNRFLELHCDMANKYSEVRSLVFPPKRWFAGRSQNVVSERRLQLQFYLNSLLNILHKTPDCVLHPSRTSVYSKSVLWEVHPFFRKGLFESSKQTV